VQVTGHSTTNRIIAQEVSVRVAREALRNTRFQGAAIQGLMEGAERLQQQLEARLFRKGRLINIRA